MCQRIKPDQSQSCIKFLTCSDIGYALAGLDFIHSVNIRSSYPPWPIYIRQWHPPARFSWTSHFEEYHLPSLSFCVFAWESRLSLVCMQYSSRVWMPPPQRAVWLARRLSCWVSKGSTWHSVHSVVLQPYLDEEKAVGAKVLIQENGSPFFSGFLLKLKLTKPVPLDPV